jgi:hypothetical protein
MGNDFPQNQWEKLLETMTTGGPDAVLDFIDGFDTFEQKLKLYFFAQQSFGGQDWEGKNFDGYLAVVQAGIKTILDYAGTMEDPEKANQLKDFANMLSFGMAADLAECWPGDTVPRESRHIEAGLAAAENCLAWRSELNKGPEPFHMAHWVKGMHHVSLKQFDEAVKHFEDAVQFGRKDAKDNGRPMTITVDGDLTLIMYTGYLGLARFLKDPGDSETYNTACKVLDEIVSDDSGTGTDAAFFRNQLDWVKKKFS